MINNLEELKQYENACLYLKIQYNDGITQINSAEYILTNDEYTKVVKPIIELLKENDNMFPLKDHHDRVKHLSDACKKFAIDIPKTVTLINRNAFEYCIGLIKVSIPQSVKLIRMQAFKFCINLKSVAIPNNVTEINYQTFYKCTGLTSVNLGNSVTSIGAYAFKGCTGLTAVAIPNSVTSIEHWAFRETGLTDVVIPNSVTKIGWDAFYGCTGLKKVTLPNMFNKDCTKNIFGSTINDIEFIYT